MPGTPPGTHPLSWALFQQTAGFGSGRMGAWGAQPLPTALLAPSRGMGWQRPIPFNMEIKDPFTGWLVCLWSSRAGYGCRLTTLSCGCPHPAPSESVAERAIDSTWPMKGSRKVANLSSPASSVSSHWGPCWGPATQVSALLSAPLSAPGGLFGKVLGLREFEGWATGTSSADFWLRLETPRQERNLRDFPSWLSSNDSN